MADVLTKLQRSYNMSRIRGKHTKPELIIRKALSLAGLRGYRLHYKLIGRPDIVFSKYKTAIFIDGCFWHKCPKCFIGPKSNKKFWNNKIKQNTKRDQLVNKQLRLQKWNIIRVWEHELDSDMNRIYKKILKSISRKI